MAVVATMLHIHITDKYKVLTTRYPVQYTRKGKYTKKRRILLPKDHIKTENSMFLKRNEK